MGRKIDSGPGRRRKYLRAKARARQREAEHWNPARIKSLRQDLQMSQESFAGELNVTYATVNRWENGRTRPSGTSLVGLRRLARRLSRMGFTPKQASDTVRASNLTPAEFATLIGVGEREPEKWLAGSSCPSRDVVPKLKLISRMLRLRQAHL